VVLVLRRSTASGTVKILLAGVCVTLLVQVPVMRPVLDERTLKVLAGAPPTQASWHPGLHRPRGGQGRSPGNPRRRHRPAHPRTPNPSRMTDRWTGRVATSQEVFSSTGRERSAKTQSVAQWGRERHERLAQPRARKGCRRTSRRASRSTAAATRWAQGPRRVDRRWNRPRCGNGTISGARRPDEGVGRAPVPQHPVNQCCCGGRESSGSTAAVVPN
jgi:hypothetical protein